jgi:hypothetical protein
MYVVCFAGLTANYFATPEKRIEAYSGLGFALLGAAVYGLFLRRPAHGHPGYVGQGIARDGRRDELPGLRQPVHPSR